MVARNGNRADKERLLEMGWEYQEETGWKPSKGTEEEASEEASV